MAMAKCRETYKYNVIKVELYLYNFYCGKFCRKEFWRMHFAKNNTYQRLSDFILKRKPGSPIRRLKVGSETAGD
jgi:hypothetical protein